MNFVAANPCRFSRTSNLRIWFNFFAELRPNISWVRTIPKHIPRRNFNMGKQPKTPVFTVFSASCYMVYHSIFNPARRVNHTKAGHGGGRGV